MTQNFTNAKIYKITNDYNDEVYVGSTCDTLIKRFSTHKSNSKNEKNINIPLYTVMNELGIERFRIDLVEDYPCNDKQALRQREGHFIREIGTLNKRIAGRSPKKYYQENTDKIKEQKKEYYLDNKDIINEYRKQNKDIIKEKKKEHYQANKNKINERHIEYYEAKKKEINNKRRENYHKKKLEKQQLNI